MQADRSLDVARTTLQLLALGTLITASLWILRPFLVALTWATIIVVATWPLLLHAQAWLWGKRSLAVAAMTLTLLLILVVPLYFAIETIVDNAEQIANWSKPMATLIVPLPSARLLILHDAREAGRVEAGAADERAVYVGLGHQRVDVVGLDAAPVQ